MIQGWPYFSGHLHIAKLSSSWLVPVKVELRLALSLSITTPTFDAFDGMSTF